MLVLDVEDRATTRKLLHFYCDSARNAWIARQFRRLFHEAHLTDIAVFSDTVLVTSYAEADQIFRLQDTAKRAQAAGVVSEAEGTAWLEELEQAEKAGQFFAAMTFFSSEAARSSELGHLTRLSKKSASEKRAIEVSLIGWLAQNYTTARPLIVGGAFVTVVAIGLGIVWVNRIAFRRIRQLRDL